MSVSADRVVIELKEDGRYARQELVSWWDQSKLADARVLVAGAGALGNELVKCLALLGVGHISLVDFDLVERSNLSRAVFLRESDIGRAKAEVVAQRAMELNPDVEVVPILGDLRAHFGVGKVAEYDVVLGGLDSRLARLHLNSNAYRAGVPFVDGAIEGLMGSVRVFAPPHSPCYECTMTDRDMELINVRRSCKLLTIEEEATGKVPTTATSASIVAGMQAQEAVKLIHGAPGSDSLVGRGVMVNGSTHDSYIVEYFLSDFCMAHDVQDVPSLDRVAPETKIADLLIQSTDKFGDGAYLQFEDDVVLALGCSNCDFAAADPRSSVRFGKGDLSCPSCGSELEPEVTSRVTSPEDALANLSLADLQLPEGDLITLFSGKSESEREIRVLEVATNG